jgi:predicted amidohydrolase
MDDRRLNVAAVQMFIGDRVDDNLKSIKTMMRRCASEGAELVVFPETALTGYSPTIGHGRSAEEWSAIDDALQAVLALSGELGLWTVIGSEAYDGQAWWNRLYVCSDTAEVAATYDKVHLTGGDTNYYQPGRQASLFEMRGVKVGLQICYDARFPEGYRNLLAAGAEVIVQGFYGAGSDTWKVPVLGAHLRSRAAESGCFVVAANVAGPLQIVVSQIIDPLGLVLAQANQDCEEIIMAELSLARIGDSEIRRDYFERFVS